MNEYAGSTACLWLADAMERDLVRMVVQRIGLEPIICQNRG